MPINSKYLADFAASGWYHVYSCTNNKEPLFRNDRHGNYFLKRYKEIVFPYVDTIAWSLLPNHFHLLIHVKAESGIRKHIGDKQPDMRTGTEQKFLDQELAVGVLLVSVFKRFFQAYTLAYNKDTDRSGNLFYRPFKRIRITSNDYLIQAIVYIHANAVKHGIVNDFTRYRWSSWSELTGETFSGITTKEALVLLDGRKNFIALHLSQCARYFDYRSHMEDD